ncbi:MAG TPA: HD domain-containing protein [Candidatus Saccharimonadales bacterium]|nr:HD domain-containing protein [Candidatus Saccharimonadales bacterium]
MNIETKNFEQKTDKFSDIQKKLGRAHEAAVRLGGMAIEFASIERAPRYGERRENDAEHSFMLALVAPEVAATVRPELDRGLISQFATVHDLVELETGDVATFGLTDEELSLKEAKEQQALESLLCRLPPHTASILCRYEAQQEPEARFVRLLEKGLPLIVNSTGSGERVMREDFGIEDGQTLASTEESCVRRLRGLFPEADLEIIHGLRATLAQRFQSIFEQSCPL